MIYIVATLTYITALALAFGVRDTSLRRRISAWLAPVVLVAMLAGGAWLSPVVRLIFASALFNSFIKCAVALRRPHGELAGFSRLGLLLYFTAWPGVDMAAFARRELRLPGVRDADDEWRARGLFRGAVGFVLGAASLVALGWFALSLPPIFLGWAMCAALLTTLHFGIGDVLPWLMRQVGFRVNPLFRTPLASASLEEFWSRRWNLAFVEMDRILFLRPLRKLLGPRRAIFGVFVVSGLLHEMALSFPAGGGWGGPLVYFVLQGVLVTSVEPRLRNSLLRRALAWLAILAPLPLLFHAPFQEKLILPLAYWLGGLLHTQTFDWYLHAALWLGCIGHFCILGASFNVPKQLHWREDFAQLSRFNRKIFWTYGAFIVGVIVSFGLLTGALHDELFRGDRAAVGLSLFIGAIWTARVLTDLFYFKDDDWPRGWQFEIGHVMLEFVFVCLAVLFGVVVPWHGWVVGS